MRPRQPNHERLADQLRDATHPLLHGPTVMAFTVLAVAGLTAGVLGVLAIRTLRRRTR